MSAITCGVVPKARQAVDKAIAVGIDQIGAFSPRPNPRRSMGSWVVQGMNQMRCIAINPGLLLLVMLLLLLCHFLSLSFWLL